MSRPRKDGRVTALSVLHRRVLRLWQWGFDSSQIEERLRIPRLQVADIARRLRQRDFALDLHRRPATNPRPATAGAKRRACLRCRKEFQSEGSGNRICSPCKKTVDWNTLSYDLVDPRWW